MADPRRFLIPDIGAAWRFASVRLALAAVAWGLLPADTQAAVLDLVGVPPDKVPAIIGALFIVGRLVQRPLRETRDDPPAG